jgi:CheY-like chemotaxis protein
MPIILCTGFSHELDEEKVLTMGIRALVMKPVGKQMLAREVRRVLDAKASGPEPIDPR